MVRLNVALLTSLLLAGMLLPATAPEATRNSFYWQQQQMRQQQMLRQQRAMQQQQAQQRRLRQQQQQMRQQRALRQQQARARQRAIQQRRLVAQQQRQRAIQQRRQTQVQRQRQLQQQRQQRLSRQQQARKGKQTVIAQRRATARNVATRALQQQALRKQRLLKDRRIRLANLRTARVNRNRTNAAKARQQSTLALLALARRPVLAANTQSLTLKGSLRPSATQQLFKKRRLEQRRKLRLTRQLKDRQRLAKLRLEKLRKAKLKLEKARLAKNQTLKRKRLHDKLKQRRDQQRKQQLKRNQLVAQANQKLRNAFQRCQHKDACGRCKSVVATVIPHHSRPVLTLSESPTAFAQSSAELPRNEQDSLALEHAVLATTPGIRIAPRHGRQLLLSLNSYRNDARQVRRHFRRVSQDFESTLQLAADGECIKEFNKQLKATKRNFKQRKLLVQRTWRKIADSKGWVKSKAQSKRLKADVYKDPVTKHYWRIEPSTGEAVRLSKRGRAEARSVRINVALKETSPPKTTRSDGNHRPTQTAANIPPPKRVSGLEGKRLRLNRSNSLVLNRKGIDAFMQKNEARLKEKLNRKVRGQQRLPFDRSEFGVGKATAAVRETLASATRYSEAFMTKRGQNKVVDIYSEKTGLTVRVRQDGTFDTLIDGETTGVADQTGR